MILWVCRLNRHCGFCTIGNRPECCASAFLRHRHPSVAGKNARNRDVQTVRATGFLRINKFQLIAGLLHKRAFGLRADTNPVNRGWHGQGSLVSMAVSKPCAATASSRAASSCRHGSPPVNTTSASAPGSGFRPLRGNGAARASHRRIAAVLTVRADKIRIAKGIGRLRGRAPAPTRDCNRQNDRKRRPPHWPPSP